RPALIIWFRRREAPLSVMPSMRGRGWDRSISLGAWRTWARTSYQPRFIPVLGSISFSIAIVIEVWAREMPSQSWTALAPLSLATGVILFIGDAHRRTRGTISVPLSTVVTEPVPALRP